MLKAADNPGVRLTAAPSILDDPDHIEHLIRRRACEISRTNGSDVTSDVPGPPGTTPIVLSSFATASFNDHRLRSS
jgi:hypothetical protein